jgi:hypothetical protein
MNRPKVFKALRIGWTVGWGLLAVLLIVLWVRSYWGRTTREILVTPSHRYYIHSLGGTVAFNSEQRIFISVEVQLIYQESDFLHLTTNAGIRILRDDSNGTVYAVLISYWLLEATALCIAAAPWLRWRFSLRTLLIATTLVALGLGLICYVAQ